MTPPKKRYPVTVSPEIHRAVSRVAFDARHADPPDLARNTIGKVADIALREYLLKHGDAHVREALTPRDAEGRSE